MKKGEIYKALMGVVRCDPDFFEPDKNLFEKNWLYKCEKDGTLHSLGTFSDEPIDEKFDEIFELVGHFTPKATNSEIRKEAMRLAFNTNPTDFEMFYETYENEFEALHNENDKINENEMTYINGHKGLYWEEYRKNQHSS